MTSSTASRDARLISAGTLLSRFSGLARVVVASAVMGTGALGGLYETTNRIPNFLFDLFAGGALQAVLIPAFVRAREEGGPNELRRLADAVSGALTMFLGVVTAAGMAATPLIIRALTAAEPNGGVRSDMNSLGTVFMLIFIPQVMCYGMAVVATAVLAARHRFVAAATAPAINNVVVIAAYWVFWVMRDGKPPSLSLGAGELAVLAGGTTLAVLAFTSVPVWMALRSGEVGRPRLARSVAGASGLHRAGTWAIIQVAGTLVITIGAVVIGNGSENGVGAFLWAQNFLWLPVGLVAAPLATALGPRLVSARSAGDAGDAAGRRDSEGALVLATTGLAASAALLVGLGWPATRLVAFGEAVQSGYAPLAHTLVAFGLGLIGTGLMFFVVRMLFSIDDARGAAVTTGILAVAGIVAMVICADVATRADRAPALAVGFGAAHIFGSAIMLVRYARVSGWVRLRSCARPMVAALCSGAVSCLVTLRLADAFPTSRVGALGAILVCAPIGLLVFGLLTRVIGGTRLSALVHWERTSTV